MTSSILKTTNKRNLKKIKIFGLLITRTMAMAITRGIKRCNFISHITHNRFKQHFKILNENVNPFQFILFWDVNS